MKITGLLVLKCNPKGTDPEGTDPVILANATDVSHFNLFHRPSVRQLIVFFSRTVAKQTPPGQRGAFQHEELQKATPLLDLQWRNQDFVVLDEYHKNFGDSWSTVQAYSTQPWPYLNQALTKFQDPAEADKLLKIQKELDQTKIDLHNTIDIVLERGEKLKSLIKKSSDLSAASKMFYEGAQQTNRCCTIL